MISRRSIAASCTILAYEAALEIAGVAFCRACSASTPPTCSSSPSRDSSSATVIVSTGSPDCDTATATSKMCWWAGL